MYQIMTRNVKGVTCIESQQPESPAHLLFIMFLVLLFMQHLFILTALLAVSGLSMSELSTQYLFSP